jgi:selenide,water dikinase
MAELTQVLRPLIPVDSEEALVDASTRDDAAVYRLNPERALVITVDFFGPVVDDGFDFGRIAAANALSDIYAMGGRALFALNLLGFPRKLLSSGVLEEIMAGGQEIATLAGIPILGGHSIDDPEPKFGMVAVGEVHPDGIVTNAGLALGDHLVLTKPLGTGIIATAVKGGAATEGEIEAAVRSMTHLNREAAEAMTASGVRAATDVTGYGLLGHLRTMLSNSGVSATLRRGDVPLLPGTVRLAEAGHIPGGTRRNLEDLGGTVRFDPGLSEVDRLILADAQTSGGLLMAAGEEILEDLLARLDGGPFDATVIGRVTDGPEAVVTVEP